LKNNIRAEQMKGNDGELGQDVPDLDLILDFCRRELSQDRRLGQRKFRVVAGVKQEVTVEHQMQRHYHKVTQADLEAEDAPDCTKDSAADQMLQVHHWVPDRAGRGRHRMLLCHVITASKRITIRVSVPASRSLLCQYHTTSFRKQAVCM